MLNKITNKIKTQKWANKKTERGFTLIELLVVIAIIGILAGILFVAINPKEQTDKAKAAKIARDLKAIEKAFILTAADKNRNTYPTEAELGSGNNPTIEKLVNDSNLDYISKKINPNIGNHGYHYDNEGDIYPYLNSCPGDNSTQGANIVTDIPNINTNSILLELDRIIDNSDGLKCGKIRISGNELFFNLDDNQ